MERMTDATNNLLFSAPNSDGSDSTSHPRRYKRELNYSLSSTEGAGTFNMFSSVERSKQPTAKSSPSSPSTSHFHSKPQHAMSSSTSFPSLAINNLQSSHLKQKSSFVSSSVFNNNNPTTTQSNHSLTTTGSNNINNINNNNTLVNNNNNSNINNNNNNNNKYNLISRNTNSTLHTHINRRITGTDFFYTPDWKDITNSNSNNSNNNLNNNNNNNNTEINIQ